jgi:uncharacterized protein (UPF0332 family)
MSSATMASRLLDAADSLLQEDRRSMAFRRRAVSTAYYAVFHALAKLSADYLTRSAKRNSEEYSRVYSSLNHGPLKAAFGQSPLKDNKRLSGIGAAVVRSQAERHRADYLPPMAGIFTRDAAQELVDLAREAVAELEGLKPQHKDCRTLATCLLFFARERNQ